MSTGATMFTGGDEALRTMLCNNNAYNVDSNANGLPYPLSSDAGTLQTFTQRLLAFRRAHPALHPNKTLSTSQLQWYQSSGATADSTYLGNVSNHAVGWRIDAPELGEAGPLFIAYNGWSGQVTFKLPSPGTGKQWFEATETCNASEGPDQFAMPGSERMLGGAGTSLPLCARGLSIMVAR
jgi:glycogen operon protein